jgi:hypothetical protein
VYLHTQSSQYIPPPQAEAFGPNDPQALDALAYMFPNATQIYSHPSMSIANDRTLTGEYYNHQPALFSHGNMSQGSFPPDMTPVGYGATIPQHPPRPTRRASFPHEIYTSSTTSFTPQISPSSQSPQPHSPVTPNSATYNKPPALPKIEEPQIRMTLPFHEYSRSKPKSIPLDPTTFGR